MIPATDFALGVLTGLLIGVLVTLTALGIQESIWHEHAIERGHGEICPDDTFAWIGECSETSP
jgi:hypothetical protein